VCKQRRVTCPSTSKPHRASVSQSVSQSLNTPVTSLVHGQGQQEEPCQGESIHHVLCAQGYDTAQAHMSASLERGRAPVCGLGQ
jgi:hypothetical protein